MKKTLFALGAVALLSATLHPETTTYAQVQAIEQTEKELSNVNQQIQRINQAIKDNQSLIQETETSIGRAQKELEDVREETKAIQSRIDARTAILENRIRAVQTEGSKVSYLDVLLEAEDFGDFIDRVSAVATLVQADQDLMDQQAKDAKKVLEKEQFIQDEIHKLEEKKTDLLDMKMQIEEQKAQTMDAKKLLEQQQKEKRLLEESLKLAKEESLKQVKEETKTPLVKPNKEEIKQAKITAKPKAVVAKVATATATPTNNEKPSSDSVQTVISAGNKYIGNSVYVFGGGRTASDVAKGRFDCSGFVSWAFKQAGVSLPAHTDGLKGVGSRVSLSEMKPGDLVFFDTYKKDGHVGIYLGNGKFIGSQSSTGVGIADLNSGYWGDRFNGRVNRVL